MQVLFLILICSEWVDFAHEQLDNFEAPGYPEDPKWYHGIMRFLLKRYEGAISYTEFYEMIDDDMWVLYTEEVKTAEEEAKLMNKDYNVNGGEGNVPEPVLPPEDPKAVSFVDEIIGDE